MRASEASTFRPAPWLAVVALMLAGGAAAPHAANGERMNPLIRLLESGRTAIGVWTGAIGAPRIAKTLATSDVDFIVADVEHDLYDFPTLHRFLLEVQDFSRRYRAEPRRFDGAQRRPEPAEGREAPAVIVKLAHRAGWDPRYEIAETLKVGAAAGVWIPFVESRADLERAISAVRGAETSAMAGMNIPRERRDVWPLNPRGELIVVAMIESDEGVRHAAEIVSTPGVTAVQPVHLSEADTARIVKLCRDRKVFAATDATPADIKARADEGYRLISVGWDFGLLRDALGSAVKSMRSAVR